MVEILPGLYSQNLCFLTGNLSLIAAAAVLRTGTVSVCAPTPGASSSGGLLAVCSMLAMIVVGIGLLLGVDDKEEELRSGDARCTYIE